MLQEKDLSFLLVDTSYMVHFLSFSTLNWYAKHFDLPDSQEELFEIDFGANDDYCKLFQKKFDSCLNSFIKRFSINPSNIFFALDCSKKNIWRRSIFSDYKLHRMVTEKKGLNRGPVFNFMFSRLLPEYTERTHSKIINHPTCEGDDILAIAKKIIRNKYPSAQVIILGSDKDLMQLIDDNTQIITMIDKCLNEESKGPKRDLLEKILLGDGSDGIPSVFNKVKGDKVLGRGLGQKALEKLLSNQELLKEKFKLYPEAVAQFKLNQQLIDFKNIPKEIQMDVGRKILMELQRA